MFYYTVSSKNTTKNILSIYIPQNTYHEQYDLIYSTYNLKFTTRDHHHFPLTSSDSYIFKGFIKYIANYRMPVRQCPVLSLWDIIYLSIPPPIKNHWLMVWTQVPVYHRCCRRLLPRKGCKYPSYSSSHQGFTWSSASPDL